VPSPLVLTAGVYARGLLVVRNGWYPDLWIMLETPVFQAYCGTEAPEFANEAELECAKILDYYGVPWEYEPRTFVLETDEAGRVLEAFTPDFYLPEQDLYVELTVMKQSLVTRKNRKLRKLRERYPDVKVKLFYRRDFERLAQKYGLSHRT
jgi:hypoxanthine phosphoribosyltransferase